MQDDLFSWADRKAIIDASEIFKDRAAEVFAQRLVNHALGNKPIRRAGEIIRFPEKGQAA